MGVAAWRKGPWLPVETVWARVRLTKKAEEMVVAVAARVQSACGVISPSLEGCYAKATSGR